MASPSPHGQREIQHDRVSVEYLPYTLEKGDMIESGGRSKLTLNWKITTQINLSQHKYPSHRYGAFLWIS